MTITPELTPELTLGDLVTEDPGRSRVLERFGLDYCCGGQQTLEDACRQAGLDQAEVLAALAQAPSEPSVDWSALSLDEFSTRIVDTHHAFLWRELPRLTELVAKVATVHGANHPELAELREVYEQLRAELEPHLLKEERILFPAITAVEQGRQPQVPPQHPIQVMLTEHDAAGELLARLRTISDGYTAPADGCASYRAMMAGLAELEHDTHVHIHLENNQLFPRALELVGAAR